MLGHLGMQIPGVNPTYSRTPGKGIAVSDTARWEIVNRFEGPGVEGLLLQGDWPRRIGLAIDGMDLTLAFPDVRGVTATRFYSLGDGTGVYAFRKAEYVDRSLSRPERCNQDWGLVGISPEAVRVWHLGGCNVPFSFAPSAETRTLIVTAMESRGNVHFRVDPATLTASGRLHTDELSVEEYAAVYGLPTSDPVIGGHGTRLGHVDGVAPAKVRDPGVGMGTTNVKLD